MWNIKFLVHYMDMALGGYYVEAVALKVHNIFKDGLLEVGMTRHS